MSNLLIKDRDIVVPGEVLAEGMDYLPSGGAFREGEKIIASQLGLVYLANRVIKLIPLTGKYTPKRGDTIIGRIVEMTFSNWFVDIGCSNDGVLSLREVPEYVEKGADLSTYYGFNEYIVAKIYKVTRGSIDLSMKGPGLRKLGTGKLVKVVSSKVPRIIGKEGSMIKMIKDATDCRITVGQNGIVWIQGEPEDEFLAAETIKLVERKAHTEGLTDEISKFLETKTKGRKKKPTTDDKGEE
ncbi:MAG: exosome complex RNA-binding protein Rrp4 [Candidatus Nanoarchaeia archaeon]|nr:exosome complex RNA-binding protein Rrp4 [Candidatus Nanoarchaeia archaeon]